MDKDTPPAYPFLEKLDIDHNVTGEIGPFTVTVGVIPDEDAKLGEDDVTGWFTDTYEKGCVKNTRRDHGTDYEWYRPSNDTLKNAYEEYRAQGLSESAAQVKMRERIEQEMDEDADRTYWGVVASVAVNSHELGSASVWSIDSLPGHPLAPYLRELADGLIGEAFADAHKAIPKALDDSEELTEALRAALLGPWWPANE